MPRVIVLDNLSQDGLDLLDSAGNIEYEVRTGLKREAGQVRKGGITNEKKQYCQPQVPSHVGYR